MNGFYNDNPMCNWDDDDVHADDKHVAYERGLTTEKHRVTHYSDGSSTHHWGGPCGSTNYDANGEEC